VLNTNNNFYFYLFSRDFGNNKINGIFNTESLGQLPNSLKIFI